ncbi:MAG: FAD-dependent oxidoreductase [Clostridiales bacterium]|nr:FAD-dependent oxidoreductase [Clostridiales bacterium]
MIEYSYNVVVVGSGPAGLAAATAAKEAGAAGVLIVERDVSSGGILQQCIHSGFGLKIFGKELTGPEYAEIAYKKASEAGVEWMIHTTALEIREHLLVCANSRGLIYIRFDALVLAMGCRERTRGNLTIPGSRPSGIFTAGTAQKLMNIKGYSVGREIVILGSGDIGMIMARRLTLEGARVKAVVEYLPYLAGLVRNKVQCLDDYGIPLRLSHTIVDMNGCDRITSVTIAPVDACRAPIPEKSEEILCDTLLLSVGLIPENELSKTAEISLSGATKGVEVNQYMQTSRPSIFACGNVVHVNDLVDNVSLEGAKAGKSAALYAMGMLPTGREVPVHSGNGILYSCPQRLVVRETEDVALFFRPAAPGNDVRFSAVSAGRELAYHKVACSNPGTIEQLTVRKDRVGDLKEFLMVLAVQREAEK